jgi:cellobiose dehydrogenase (acceptor)
VPNDHPDQKNHTYGHSTFFLENAERHGPLRTYLVTAAQREKFDLWTNTNARRLVRTGGHVTGVELECTKGGAVGPGFSGIVNVTAGTGRVIVSAGTMGSAKLLMRSKYNHSHILSVFVTRAGGIGPKDQLEVVKNSAVDGATMIPSDQWIELPVGYNLNDHVGVSEQRPIERAAPLTIVIDRYPNRPSEYRVLRLLRRMG